MSWQPDPAIADDDVACAHAVTVGVYLLGCLSTEDTCAFVEHLAGCGACRMEADALRPVVRLLGTVRHR